MFPKQQIDGFDKLAEKIRHEPGQFESPVIKSFNQL